MYITQKTQDPKTLRAFAFVVYLLYITQKTQDPKTDFENLLLYLQMYITQKTQDPKTYRYYNIIIYFFILEFKKDFIVLFLP